VSLGTLFIISAPSGAGKTSLVRALKEQTRGITVSVSHTTRAQRPGEQHAKDYYFVSRDLFLQMVNNGDFLEHAQVFDNLYGTAKNTIDNFLRDGLDVILEIDWQGARQIRELMPFSKSIFILPPSLEELENRLSGRGQDGPDVIARRMADAISEISHHAEYDYLVVNDSFDTALNDLTSIIEAARLRVVAQVARYEHLISGLLS
jgi:guanylate kinase